MAGLLTGLAGLGLDNLENMDIYETPEKETKPQGMQEPENAHGSKKVEEKELIFEKTYECPVCDKSFTAKIMKTGKARLIGTDQDLRARYEGIDAVKYDVVMCPCCGYATLTRYVGGLTSTQVKTIRENISMKVHLTEYHDEIYSYDEAMERYKLALACAVVKHAKASEKAYICLKTAWLVRGYKEYLIEIGKETVIKDLDLEQVEEQYLLNAYNGFVEARQSEGYPMCGMDEKTVDYLLAVLAAHFKKYDVAGKLVAGILTSPSANSRTKDKARDLKDQILAELKNQKK